MTTAQVEATYATHLPVIEMVLALMKPKQVLELGAGDYSTKAFLECPSLARLTSLETDQNWVARLAIQIKDPRLDLRFVDDTVEALPDDLMAYDLIFVDNADNAPDREAAIRTVLTKEHPVVILHDAEHPWYRHTIHSLAERYVIFDEQVPHTAIVW